MPEEKDPAPSATPAPASVPAAPSVPAKTAPAKSVVLFEGVELPRRADFTVKDCKHCFGVGYIRHGGVLPCPWCTKEGREEYAAVRGSE